jgi:capsular exopolysaccharide synthesis family protein
MSRIDEALRRAGRGDGFAGATTADDDAAYGIEKSIEQYASESLASSEPDRYSPAIPAAAEYTVAANHPEVTLAPWLRNKVVVSRQMTETSAEQYRRLAAVLHSLQLERGVKTLMVSSAVPQEGKTLTITNLALTLSEAYDRRVLLIDADLRRPSVHEAFGIANDTGLADSVRSGDGKLRLVDVSPRLSIATAGRLNTSAPMAELTSDVFPVVIKRASARFDWVLIDTPPAGLLPDAQLVARVADAILFVVAAGTTPYPLVQRALEALGDRVIGIVLNRVDGRRLSEADYYQSYYSKTSDR